MAPQQQETARLDHGSHEVEAISKHGWTVEPSLRPPLVCVREWRANSHPSSLPHAQDTPQQRATPQRRQRRNQLTTGGTFRGILPSESKISCRRHVHATHAKDERTRKPHWNDGRQTQQRRDTQPTSRGVASIRSVPGSTLKKKDEREGMPRSGPPAPVHHCRRRHHSS